MFFRNDKKFVSNFPHLRILFSDCAKEKSDQLRTFFVKKRNFVSYFEKMASALENSPGNNMEVCENNGVIVTSIPESPLNSSDTNDEDYGSKSWKGAEFAELKKHKGPNHLLL